MEKNPLFITFEGGEGSGKTTQSRLLCKNLEKSGLAVVQTREIGGVKIAEEIRQMIFDNSKLDPIAELLLIMAARIEHTEKYIKPSLAGGFHVICDRFFDSSFAYQGVTIPPAQILKLHRELLGNFMPHITFFMDLPPELALARAFARGDANKFEAKNLQFHQNVYENFHKLLELFPNRFIAIEANREESEIAKEIFSILSEKFLI